MYGVNIDDNPDAPVGSPATRRTIAIHWNWTTSYSDAEIASALGVTEHTVKRYYREGPTEEVQAQMDNVESEVRLVAINELREQLKAAGHRSRTAETPVEVWTDDNGHLQVNDKREPETGELTGRYPVPADIDLGPDEEARYYARAEVREILEQLTDLVGAAEPEEVELSLGDIVG